MSDSTDSHSEAVRQRRMKQRLCVAMVVMVLVLAVGSGATWWAARTVIRDVSEADGTYRWSKSNWNLKYLSRPSSPWWLRVGHVIAFDADVESVHVEGPNADDELMSRLSHLPDLEFLTITNSSITDAGLGELAKAPSLETLLVRDSIKISDVGFAQLKPLDLPRLRIEGAPINGSGLAALTSLRHLAVAGCPGFDNASLAGLKRLEGLDLSSTGITNAGMEHLAHFPNLESLGLSATVIDDAGISTVVRNCPRLEEIWLKGTGLTKTGFAELASLKRLNRVYIKRGTIPQSALSALKTALPSVTIYER